MTSHVLPGVVLGLAAGGAVIAWRRRAMAGESPVRREKWTSNFWAQEFCSRGREFAPGTRDLYKELARRALQPIRDRAGRPVVITSGQRLRDVNDAVDGAPNSRHLPPADRSAGERDGVAADLSVPGYSQAETHRLFQWITQHASELGLGAVEWYPKGNFIHVDSRASASVTHWADKSGRSAWEAGAV